MSLTLRHRCNNYLTRLPELYDKNFRNRSRIKVFICTLTTKMEVISGSGLMKRLSTKSPVLEIEEEITEWAELMDGIDIC